MTHAYIILLSPVPTMTLKEARTQNIRTPTCQTCELMVALCSFSKSSTNFPLLQALLLVPCFSVLCKFHNLVNFFASKNFIFLFTAIIISFVYRAIIYFFVFLVSSRFRFFSNEDVH